MIPRLAHIDPLNEMRVAYYAALPKRHHPDLKEICQEIPQFCVFLQRVRDNSSHHIARDVWIRVWTELRKDRIEGRTTTYDALLRLPHPDDRIVNFDPPHRRTQVEYFLRELDNLIKSVH
jgi:hypothetical protein